MDSGAYIAEIHPSCGEPDRALPHMPFSISRCRRAPPVLAPKDSAPVPAPSRTLILVKPDAFERGLTGEVLGRFERKGLRLVALRQLTIDDEFAGRHYEEHRDKPFFGELIEFITGGPLVAAVLEGVDATTAARQLIGATNPLEAAPGSIRGDYAVEVTFNLVHGSDSDESAQGETEETVVENARRKARAGKGMLVRGLQPPKLAGAGSGVAGGERILVLGVDTEVVLDGRLLGKAADEREARERLEALSGRTHDVLGGVMVIGRRDDSTLDFVGHSSTKSSLGRDASPPVPGDEVAERWGLAKSRVTFREFPPDLLAAYLASGEWRGRAGA